MSINWTKATGVTLLLYGLLCPAAMAWDAADVVRGLAKKGGDVAQFTEIKYLKALDRPIRLDGEVRFTPPDGMEKKVTAPYEELMTVSAGKLKLQRGKKVREIELDRHPVAQAFVMAFVSTLAGNIEGLEAHYDIILEGEIRGWTLELTPKADELRDKVSQIRVSGNTDLLQSFETLQPNGDRSIMYFSNLPTELGASVEVIE